MRLLGLGLLRPREFLDRVVAVLEVHSNNATNEHAMYEIVDTGEGIRTLSGALSADLGLWLQESSLAEIAREVGEKNSVMPVEAPFPSFHNGDSLLAQVCYGVARALRPKAIVETGVCYGVTSAYLLQALHVNGDGNLDSIDLPPLGQHADAFVGRLVPHVLQYRWRLHRGTSRRLLRPLVERLGAIDLFVHDSLHTYRNMRMEFDVVWPALRPGGVLISDDIEGNVAFRELAAERDVEYSVVMQQQNKASLLGIAIKQK